MSRKYKFLDEDGVYFEVLVDDGTPTSGECQRIYLR